MEIEKYIINKPGKHEINLVLDREGMDLEWRGIIEAREMGNYDLEIKIRHEVPNTFGRVVVRGIAENGARVKVNGRVIIAKSAQETDSFLEMKILLLDKLSSAVAEPELEIEANLVKASHAASVGKIDEEQIMYLRSRGVGLIEAKKLIVEGFINE